MSLARATIVNVVVRARFAMSLARTVIVNVAVRALFFHESCNDCYCECCC